MINIFWQHQGSEHIQIIFLIQRLHLILKSNSDVIETLTSAFWLPPYLDKRV